MKVINHFLKVNWILGSGKLILTILFISVFFTLNAQVKLDANSASIEIVKGKLLLSYQRKFPGEICGESNRSLFMLGNRQYKNKDFKKEEYLFHEDEFYVIFEPLYIKKFLSKVDVKQKKTLIRLLKFFTDDKNLWKCNLEDFIVRKKGKVTLKLLQEFNNNAFIIKADCAMLNDLYRNRIVVKSENKAINIAILFENESLSELEAILKLEK